MPTVSELTALYTNFMLGPRRGPGVCDVCFNFTDGYARCYACTHGEAWLDAVAPYCGITKVGLEFFLANGPDGVRALGDRPLFLDMKLHGIM